MQAVLHPQRAALRLWRAVVRVGLCYRRRARGFTKLLRHGLKQWMPQFRCGLLPRLFLEQPAVDATVSC